MRPWWPLIPLLLAGCVGGPDTLPSEGTAPAPECRWSVAGADTLSYLRRAVAGLEAEGFSIDESDLELGLVSAERSRVQVGYADAWHGGWPHRGLHGFFGFGRGAGAGISLGWYRSFDADPTRLERLSLLMRNDEVTVSRDILIVDPDGWVLVSRTAADAEFCRDLRQTIDRQPGGEAS